MIFGGGYPFFPLDNKLVWSISCSSQKHSIIKKKKVYISCIGVQVAVLGDMGIKFSYSALLSIVLTDTHLTSPKEVVSGKINMTFFKSHISAKKCDFNSKKCNISVKK